MIVRVGAKDETVDDAAVARIEPTRAGAVVELGEPRAAKVAYTADGVPRRHYRKAADGRLLVWGRASVSEAERVDDAAALVGVPDDNNGWRDVTPAGGKAR